MVGLLEKNINTGFTDLVLEIDGRMVGYSTNPITAHVHHIEKRQKKHTTTMQAGRASPRTRWLNPHREPAKPAPQSRIAEAYNVASAAVPNGAKRRFMAQGEVSAWKVFDGKPNRNF